MKEVSTAKIKVGNGEDVIKLTNLMLPHLQKVLARQRRDYGIDEESFPREYPVEEQATNIDDTPVHNIGMERQCSKVDYRLQKLGTLPVVSRSIILQRCQQLRYCQNPSFRGYRQQLWLKEGWSFNGVSRSRPTLQGGRLRSRR